MTRSTEPADMLRTIARGGTMTACTNHNWQPDGDTHYTCTECDVTTNPCTQCGRPLDTVLTVCDPCLNRARRIITDITGWMRAYDFGVQLINLRAIRYDRDKIITSDDDARLPFGLDTIVTDPEDTRISAIKIPTDAVRILHDWAYAWADIRNDTAPADPLEYLTDHTLWAMQNPDTSDWDQYHTEARQVRATLRRLLGIAPEREAVPCVHCGGRITRDWTPDGLDDIRRCTACHTEWPNAARLAHTNSQVLHRLPETHPDALVTAQQARRIYPTINPATFRAWVHRKQITPAGADVRGEALYRLSDITVRHAGDDGRNTA